MLKILFLTIFSVKTFANLGTLGDYVGDAKPYREIIGWANEFKDGDEIVGVAAYNQDQRVWARTILSNTPIRVLQENPIYRDKQQEMIWESTDQKIYGKIKNWTLGQLKEFLLSHSDGEIHEIIPGLSSDVIACVVKLMSNAELIKVGQTVFNPLPGSQIGSKGYMGARIQPNSPTDNPEDIAWQVFNGFSFAVGDVLLGNNPADSSPESIYRIENTLKDIVQTFKLEKKLAWSVLSHVDIQNEVEKFHPGSTDLFFQSIGGVDDANQTFGISVNKILGYAQQRKNLPHGFYFETGQGADFTNRHGHGFDMVVHESRKYGLARAAQHHMAWVIVNDVAGFIGPEVFKTKEQLVRACLEDIVMGKLHGLTIGLDICTTLHMSISLEDLKWCQDQIMPANPAYLMALPTRNDPMLSYLTTSFRDHVRIRNQFNYKVNDDMWQFYIQLGVIDTTGKPTSHFGDPVWVYTQYQLRKGDPRNFEVIYAEGQERAKQVESRGVLLDHGQPDIETRVQKLYHDAKNDIWSEFSPQFIQQIPNRVILRTRSKNRSDYIAHPSTGEQLTKESERTLQKLRETQRGRYNAQIVISDGLNAESIMNPKHLKPYLKSLRAELKNKGFRVAPQNIVILSGRVRAGYRAGELLFGNIGLKNSKKALIHIIGERPGNGHKTFSAYLVAPTVSMWSQPGFVDHNHARLVSGISATSLLPENAAKETSQFLASLVLEP